MNIKISIHSRNVPYRIEKIKNWKISPEDKKFFPKFIVELSEGGVNKGKRLTPSTQLRYLDILKDPLTFLNKPFSKTNKADWKRYDQHLEKRKKRNGEVIKKSVKIKTRVQIRIYLGWRIGESKALEMTDFFDMREESNTPDALKQKDVKKIILNCSSNEKRFATALGTDGGLRVEEIYNVRLEDVELPDKDNPFVKISVKEEYSKTMGRVISLYQDGSNEIVREYYEERIKEGAKPKDPLMKTTYDAMRRFYHRLGQKVLNRPLNFHLFRHTSATHYANKLNRQELCYRYGWKFSSNMPDVYISRSGMLSKDLDVKFESTSVEEIKTKMFEQTQEISMLKSRNAEADLKAEVHEMVKEELRKAMKGKTTLIQEALLYDSKGKSKQQLDEEFNAMENALSK